MADDFFARYPSSGGGGVTSLNGQTGALTLVAGTGITITPGTGTLTIDATSSGTVTSVALADSTGLFNITGSPVTTSGTLTLASLQSQSANTFLAAPDGAPGAPTFRAIVAADVPSLSALYATIDLSNLSSVAINQTLEPGADLTIELGSGANRFANTYTQKIFFASSGAPSIDLENGLFKDSTGLNSADFENKTLRSSSGLNSVDWEGRRLTDNGNNFILQYATDLIARAGDDGVGNGYFATFGTSNTDISGPVTILSGNAAAGNSGDISITTGTATGDSGNIHIIIGTATGTPGQIIAHANIVPSADGAFTLGDSTHRFTSANIADLLDSNALSSISVEGRTLNDSSGTVASIDYETGLMNDASNIISIDYRNARALYDSAGSASVDWLDRQLDDTNETVSLDWSAPERISLSKVIRLSNLVSDPGTASAGDCYYNTIVNKIKVYNGTTWETVTSV